MNFGRVHCIVKGVYTDIVIVAFIIETFYVIANSVDPDQTPS